MQSTYYENQYQRHTFIQQRMPQSQFKYGMQQPQQINFFPQQQENSDISMKNQIEQDSISEVEDDDDDDDQSDINMEGNSSLILKNENKRSIDADMDTSSLSKGSIQNSKKKSKQMSSKLSNSIQPMECSSISQNQVEYKSNKTNMNNSNTNQQEMLPTVTGNMNMRKSGNMSNIVNTSGRSNRSMKTHFSFNSNNVNKSIISQKLKIQLPLFLFNQKNMNNFDSFCKKNQQKAFLDNQKQNTNYFVNQSETNDNCNHVELKQFENQLSDSQQELCQQEFQNSFISSEGYNELYYILNAYNSD